MKKAALIVYISVVILFAGLITGVIAKNFGVVPKLNPPQDIDRDDYYINLNTASVKDLMLIPGVSQSLAEEIVKYREENGPFTDYSDLLKVKGIGQSKIREILEYGRIE